MTDGRRGQPIATRVDASERRAIERAAKAAGLPVGTWIRIVVLAAAGKHNLADALARVTDDEGGAS